MISWLSIQNRIQHFSTCISLFFNSILIYLIYYYSPKKIGNYKYLMIFITVFQIFHSLMDAISLPIYHTVSSVFVVFKDIREEDFIHPTVHYVFLLVYTGCYGFCMAIFGVHFFYRYRAINGKIKCFTGRKIYFWLAIPPFFHIAWSTIVGVFLAPSSETDAEISDSILASYDLKMDQIVYVAGFVWSKNSTTNQKYPNWKAVTGIGMLQVIVMSSLFAIFYFGIRCYCKIQKHLKQAGSISQVTKNLHRQLFSALVMQTAVPIILLHLPVSALFMFPILDTELGIMTGFVTITISIYPAIDPLPTIFIIEDYRKTVLEFFNTICGCCSTSGNAEPRQASTTGRELSTNEVI